MVVLADLAGGDWPEAARKAAVDLVETAQENNPIGSLFLDLLLLFSEAQTERLFSHSIVAGLERFIDRPWAELRRGKQLTEQWLARQLRPYGIFSKTFWIEGRSAKGYAMADFMEVFKRYIPRSEIEALRAQLPESQPGQKGDNPTGAQEGGEQAAA